MPTCPMCNADADDMDTHKADVHGGESSDQASNSQAPSEPQV